MTRLLCCAALAALTACGPRIPPAYISVSDEFSANERIVIEDVVLGGWCEASGGQWCPELKLWSDRGRISLVDHLELDENDERNCPEGQTCVVTAHNDGDNIEVARDALATNPIQFWRTIAHELGHYCTRHVRRGLMDPTHGWGTPDFESTSIDSESLSAWREGCGL